MSSDSIRELLVALFREVPAGPFLFVGSGFSRRYLGLGDWKGLLSRFCTDDRPVEYYLAAADGDLPTAAKLLAKDFNERWWSAEEFKASVARYKDRIKDNTSALRVEICSYLSKLDNGVAKGSGFERELELLSSLNVDGIITTNWDLFLEQLFPDYRVFVGQEELLFSNPQEIGEIYKIHGSCSRPESLVLTDADYSEFAKRNAYLAAKLITIFVEHPIVFLGYSISDPNITTLLRDISLCIGKENVEKLRRNLIFVQRPVEGDAEGISDTYITIDGVQIPLVLVRASNFSEIYEAIDATKRKIPARVLRFCKEQLCELVKSSEPEKKLCVVDIDEIEKKDDVEFLVGVGVAKHGERIEESKIGDLGYVPIESGDLIADLLHDDHRFDPRQVAENVIRVAGRNTRNIPVFKYLRELGINSLAEYESSGFALDRWVRRELREFRVKAYAAPFRRNYRHASAAEIIDCCTPENAAAFIPFLAPEKIDLVVLRQFLLANIEKLDYAKSSYASNFRKLAALYDRLKWGW